MSLLALDEFLEIDPDDPVAEKFDFFGVSIAIFTCRLKKLLFVFARCFLVFFLRKILLYIQHLLHHTSCAADDGDARE
jgi:hypothetical protein